MKEIFIIGSKGIPAKYGGFETFVDKLTEKKKSKDIKYHVACMAKSEGEFEYNGARCFNINVPSIGPAKAVYYDISALKQCIKYIEEKKVEEAIVYILACRIGPFIGHYKKKLESLGVKLYVNPDGHEWKRGKWNKAIQKYWKLSEKLMVKHADLLICDSKNIEKYIKEDYNKYNPNTEFIAYGADISKSEISTDDNKLMTWYEKNDIKTKEYYLIVGRFVPENNYELIIREFMKSKSKKDLVIISNVENNKFYKQLVANTSFNNDRRIKFVGTVYDEQLLKKIRENAFAYFHGHEVGGTNPSLLEALGSTPLNILINVGFNKEVAEDGAVYFNKTDGHLSNLIEVVEKLSLEQIDKLMIKAQLRISNYYSWQRIVGLYEGLFLREE